VRQELSKASGLSEDTISKANYIDKHKDQNQAAELKLLAERKGGELLRGMDSVKKGGLQIKCHRALH